MKAAKLPPIEDLPQMSARLAAIGGHVEAGPAAGKRHPVGAIVWDRGWMCSVYCKQCGRIKAQQLMSREKKRVRLTSDVTTVTMETWAVVPCTHEGDF
jgi:hypothetical protein